MNEMTKTKIKNYVTRFLIQKIIKDEYTKKTYSSNLLITSYFRRNLYHINTNNDEKRKFFFSFRAKYIGEFKRVKKQIATNNSSFRNRVAYKEFKSKFTPEEWDKMNGERLAIYMAMFDGSVKKIDFEFAFNIIKITNNK